MTIASADREIRELIREKHVVGAEAVMNALVRACDGQPYLGRDYLHVLLDQAFRRLEEEKKNE